jgi:hypothetical protein
MHIASKLASFGFVTVVLALAVAACSKTSAGAPGSSGSEVASGANLTVEGYCGAFCPKLCGTCGDAACPQTCKPRCYFGRPGTMVLDGKDPKIGLARTQKDLDGCLATITSATCPSIMAGNVPPACYTIQH